MPPHPRPPFRGRTTFGSPGRFSAWRHRRMKRKRRDADLRYAEVATPGSRAEVFHVSPSSTLPPATNPRQTLPSTAQDLCRASGPLDPRHGSRPTPRPRQRGVVSGTNPRTPGKHSAAAVARVLSGKNRQGGRQARTPTTRLRPVRLLRAAAAMDSVVPVVSAAGPGSGPHDAGRASARPVRQRRLPRLGDPGGLENPPRPATRAVAPALVRPARWRPARDWPRLGGAGADRSRLGIAPLVPDDCRARLASADARPTGGHISARGLAPFPRAERFRRPRRRALRRRGPGLQNRPHAAGWHAVGLPGSRSRRAVVVADRPAAASRQPLPVRVSGLDRAGIQGDQKRRPAVAIHARDRSRRVWNGTGWPSPWRRRGWRPSAARPTRTSRSRRWDAWRRRVVASIGCLSKVWRCCWRPCSTARTCRVGASIRNLGRNLGIEYSRSRKRNWTRPSSTPESPPPLSPRGRGEP